MRDRRGPGGGAGAGAFVSQAVGGGTPVAAAGDWRIPPWGVRPFVSAGGASQPVKERLPVRPSAFDRIAGPVGTKEDSGALPSAILNPMGAKDHGPPPAPTATGHLAIEPPQESWREVQSTEGEGFRTAQADTTRGLDPPTADPSVSGTVEKESGVLVGIPRLQLDKTGHPAPEVVDPAVPETAVLESEATDPSEDGAQKGDGGQLAAMVTAGNDGGDRRIVAHQSIIMEARLDASEATAFEPPRVEDTYVQQSCADETTTNCTREMAPDLHACMDVTTSPDKRFADAQELGTPNQEFEGMTQQEGIAYAKLKEFCSNIVKKLAPPLLKEVQASTLRPEAEPYTPQRTTRATKKLSGTGAAKATPAENVLLKALGLVPGDMSVDERVMQELKGMFNSPL